MTQTRRQVALKLIDLLKQLNSDLDNSPHSIPTTFSDIEGVLELWQQIKNQSDDKRSN